MDDEMLEEPKRKGGWPKGKPRKAPDEGPRIKAKPGKIKAAPNWDSEDFVGVGQDYVDRLHIPREIIDAVHADGYTLQWCTHEIRGMPTPQELSKMTRGGWTPVHNTDFDGILEGRFISKGVDVPITVEDCLLCVRPTEIHTKSKMLERRQALAPVQIVEQQIGRGLPVAGGNHPSAMRGNHINRHMERIEIPE